MTPSIVERPQALYPSVDTFTDLQTWIDMRLEGIEGHLGDDETLQYIGIAGKARLDGLRALLLDIAFMIRGAVTAESDERAQDAYAEAAEREWKELRDDGASESELRALAGDR